MEATRMVGTASALSIYLNINVTLCCRWLWSKWVPSAYICSMHNIKNLNCYSIPVRRASVWLIIDWLNYAAGRQLKETSAWEPSFIHSATSTRLLFKHRSSNLQVAEEMTSLTTRGFNVLQCLLRAEETRQLCGFLQVFVGLTSL